MESIGQRISQLRKEKSLSQEYIAEQIGVTRQAVSKWENDTSAPDTYNLIALAELFDVSVEYIATGKKEEPPQVVLPVEQKTEKITVQKIVGFILLGAGIISLILGMLLSFLLIFLSAYLITSGIICLVAKKKTALIIIVVCLILSALIFCCTFFQYIPSFFTGGGEHIYSYEFTSLTNE